MGEVEMRIMSRSFAAIAATLVFAVGVATPAVAGPPADWSKVKARSVNMFYPGASTYDWLLSREHKKGNKKVPGGTACAKCHDGDEQDMGEAILAGDHPLEEKPPKGVKGYIKLSVQAAHDADNLYVRFKWKSQSKGPVRVTMMLDDGKVPNFATQGCWLTCHNGMRSTPTAASEAKVKANPYFGDSGLKKKDIRKYLAASRTDGKSWDKPKSAAEIAKIKKAGGFVDLIYWRMKDGKAQTKDAYVLDYRLDDAKDSVGDASKSTGELKDGTYTVVIQRKLNTGHPDDKALKPGGIYTVGFAIHDGEVGDRYHHTAFPLKLGIDKKADITATAVK